MNETTTNDTIKAVIAAVAAMLSGMATLLGIDPATVPYIAGLAATAITSGVSLFFAIRRLRAGQPVQGELPLA